MTTVPNIVPSTVMVESYNNKIKRIINYKDDDVVSWTVYSSGDAGLTPVSVVLRNGDTKSFDTMRYSLSEVLNPNEDGFVLLNRAAMDIYMQDYPGSEVGFQEKVALASNVDLDNDELLFSSEFEHTLLFWGLTNNFIPPQEITVTDISKEQNVIDYIATLGSTFISSSKVAAKENSLGFIGEVNVLVTNDLAFEPPVEEVTRKYDLDKATNCGIPGEWHVYLERETADMSDFDFEASLSSLMGGELYSPGGLNLYHIDLEKTITHDGVNSTYTITPVDKSIENEAGGTLNIVYKEQVPLDLSAITNIDEPGKFEYPYYIRWGWTTQTAGQIADSWFYAWGTPQNIAYKYSRFNKEMADDVDVPEGYKAVRITPAEDSNRFRTIGELILLVKELDTDPVTINRVQLNDGGFFGPYYETGTWSVPPNYDIEMELMRMADQIVTQQSSGYFMNPVQTVRLQDIVLTEDNGIVTVKPHPNSIWIRASGEHKVTLIVDESLVGVDRDYDAFDLNTVTNVDVPGTWTIPMAKADGFDTEGSTYLTDALSQISAMYPDYDLILDDIDVQVDPSQLTIRPKYDNLPCRTKGYLQIKAEYPKTDLSLITNNDVPGTWTHLAPSDRAYLGAMSYDVTSNIEKELKLGLNSYYIEKQTIDETSFKLFPKTSEPLPKTMMGELIVNYTVMPPPPPRIDLTLLTNNGTPGTWTYTTNDLDDSSGIRAGIFAALSQELLDNHSTVVVDSDYSVWSGSNTDIRISASDQTIHSPIMGQVNVTVVLAEL